MVTLLWHQMAMSVGAPHNRRRRRLESIVARMFIALFCVVCRAHSNGNRRHPSATRLPAVLCLCRPLSTDHYSAGTSSFPILKIILTPLDTLNCAACASCTPRATVLCCSPLCAESAIHCLTHTLCAVVRHFLLLHLEIHRKWDIVVGFFPIVISFQLVNLITSEFWFYLRTQRIPPSGLSNRSIDSHYSPHTQAESIVGYSPAALSQSPLSATLPPLLLTRLSRFFSTVIISTFTLVAYYQCKKENPIWELIVLAFGHFEHSIDPHRLRIRVTVYLFTFLLPSCPLCPHSNCYLNLAF